MPILQRKSFLLEEKCSSDHATEIVKDLEKIKTGDDLVAYFNNIVETIELYACQYSLGRCLLKSDELDCTPMQRLELYLTALNMEDESRNEYIWEEFRSQQTDNIILDSSQVTLPQWLHIIKNVPSGSVLGRFAFEQIKQARTAAPKEQ